MPTYIRKVIDQNGLDITVQNLDIIKDYHANFLHLESIIAEKLNESETEIDTVIITLLPDRSLIAVLPSGQTFTYK